MRLKKFCEMSPKKKLFKISPENEIGKYATEILIFFHFRKILHIKEKVASLGFKSLSKGIVVIRVPY
jgi:hypothetical protein